jgi:hypothetical protein
MDRAPLTPGEFAAFRHGLASPAPLSAAQAATLRRARELSVELADIVGAVRAHLAELEAAEPFAEEVGLGEGEMRAAFAAARITSGSGPRPRWADALLGGA